MRLLFFTLFLLFPLNSHACSCEEKTDIKSRFDRAYAVILAEITNTKLVKTTYSDHDVEYIVADIDIIETFKKSGKVITQVIDLVPDIGNCSIGLISGLEYVLFISHDDEADSEEKDDIEKLGTNNYVGICTGSHQVNIYHKNFEKKAQELRGLAQ